MSDRAAELAGGQTAWIIRNELASLEHAYASGEVLGVPAHCLIGTEIDYDIRLNMQTQGQEDALELSREAIVAELSMLVPKDEDQAQRLAGWLAQVPNLTNPELINYHIYRRLSTPTLDAPVPEMYLRADDSPETTLEFAFGNGLYQTGYYDNPGMFEMRTQAAKPTIAQERVQRAVAEAKETAESFGASFDYRRDQTNFSVWVRGEDGLLRPVHNLNSSEGQEIARKATAGVLHALRDSMVVLLHPPSTLTTPYKKPLRLDSGPGRGVTLRVVPDRIENRREVGIGNHALAGLVVMSGFAHGVKDPALDTSFVESGTQPLLVAGPGYVKTRDLYLLRALQQSKVVNGRYVSPRESESNTSRLEGMLGSIIGTVVYENNRGPGIIRDLIGCISLGSDGTLKADEQAFDAVLQHAQNAGLINLTGIPKETINQRLQRITYLPDSVTVRGSVDYVVPSGVSLHKDLETFVAASSLGHISMAVLEAVRQERAAEFTYEEAIAMYYHETVVRSAGSIDQKIGRFEEMITEFPDANQDEVRRLVRDKLQERITSFDKGIAGYKPKPATEEELADKEAYEERQRRRADYFELLRGLGGKLSSPQSKNSRSWFARALRKI